MHGKGYATEAVAAVLAWGDAHFSDPRTICLIHPDNVASIRVAQKCGFHEWQRATYRGEPTIVFERNSQT
jgi:RimJ/RimL family protein N-acetyltransferase